MTDISSAMLPLSHLQKGILHSELHHPELHTNNICVLLIYDENLIPELVEKSIRHIVNNNEIFRIRIEKKNGDYFQTVWHNLKWHIEKRDLSRLTKEEIRNDFNRFAFKKILISEPKLFQYIIAKLPDNQTAIYIKIHHIISDSASNFLFETQVYSFYKDYEKGLQPSSIRRNLQDYLSHESHYFNSSRYVEDYKYWKNLNLSSDILFSQHYPELKGAKRLQYRFSKEESQQIVEYCNANSISIFNLLSGSLAIWFYLTHKLETIRLMTPVHNRNTNLKKSSYGLFVNTLPYCVTIEPDLNFLTQLKKIKTDYLRFLRHSNLPNTTIFEMIETGHPQHDIFFSWEPQMVQNKQVRVIHFFEGEEITPLSIHISDRDDSGELIIETDYQISVFQEYEIRSIFSGIKHIAFQGIKNSDKKIAAFHTLSDDEAKQIQKFQTPTEFNLPIATSLVSKFKKTVAFSPQHTAVVYENTRITFHELDLLSNHLAGYLIENFPEHSGRTCACLMHKSEKTIVTLLAIWKAGFVFLSLDPDYPEERLKHMLQTSKSICCISDQEQKSSQWDIPFIQYEVALQNTKPFTSSCPVQQNAAIYFTSGTTGLPNAVQIKQHSLVNLSTVWQEMYDLQNHKKNILQLASQSFDVFLGDCCKALLSGGTLILCPENIKLNFRLLHALMISEKVHLFESTPGFAIPFMQFIADHTLAAGSLETVILGADICLNEQIQNLIKIFKNKPIFYNTYGVTEACIETTAHKINKSKITNEPITPIGFPLPGTEILILNDIKKQLPIGFAGEIHIGGIGLSDGYIDNNRLSKEKFIEHPFRKNQILYKTGDLGKWLPDGNIAFLGRKDTQIQIRGHRIEPAEIENYLHKSGFCKMSIVGSTNKNGHNTLVAWIVPTNDNISLEEIRQFLFDHLPPYMVPTEMLFVNHIPLTKNGKTNLETLQKQLLLQQKNDFPSSFPEEGTEKTILSVWRKILKTDTLKVTDHVFQHGADSIHVVLAVAELEDYGIKIEPQDIYNYPKIEHLAQYIRNPNSSQFSHEAISLTTDSSKHPPRKQNTSQETGNILLTGATGFLGVHLLHELINKGKTVYCPVRCSAAEDALVKLQSTYEYYFDLPLPSNAVILPYGKHKPSVSIFNKIEHDFSTIIHAAGLTKQTGHYNDFFRANIELTAFYIQIAQKFGKQFIHISTISVFDGFIYNETPLSETTRIRENKKEKNPYIRSKQKAEELVFNAMDDGLTAKIIRTGNISSRHSDGKPQKNINDNIFHMMFTTLLETGLFPKQLISKQLNIIPADICSKLIVQFINGQSSIDVFHVLGAKNQTGEAVYKTLSDSGIGLTLIDISFFNQKLSKILHTLKDSEKKYYLTFLSLYLSSQQNKKIIHQKNSDQLIESTMAGFNFNEYCNRQFQQFQKNTFTPLH